MEHRYNLESVFKNFLSLRGIPYLFLHDKGFNDFKSSLDFDAKLYSGKLSASMMSIEDVVTVKLVSLERKSYINEVFLDVGIVDTMDAGYFEYSEDSTLVIKRLNDMTDED